MSEAPGADRLEPKEGSSGEKQGKRLTRRLSWARGEPLEVPCGIVPVPLTRRGETSRDLFSVSQGCS